MRTFFVSLFIISMLFSIGYSQEKIDVVYLKNGDVRKGVIVENVPNDYIKIETADGSVFTIKYADIEKMVKEEKPVQQNIAVREVRKGLMARNGDFGVSLNLWLGGDIDFEGADISKETGFLLHMFYDTYVAEKFAVGAYINFSPMSWEVSDEGSTLFEIGFSFKARFPIADGAAAIKPGLCIGYRSISSDIPQSDEVNALGVNMSCEVQFDVHQIFVPYFELGFLAQPSGGNDDWEVAFPPIVYFGAGVVF
jgi:hypothetical protein